MRPFCEARSAHAGTKLVGHDRRSSLMALRDGTMDKGPIDRVERAANRAERPEKIRLGELLLELRLISPEQLKVVLEQHLKSGKKVGRLLVENGFITEDQLAQAIGKLYRTEFVDLRASELDAELVKLIPEAHARHHRMIPIAHRDGVLLVGFCDPSDLVAFDEASRILKRTIRAVVVAETALTGALDRAHRRIDQISGLVKELEQDVGDTVNAFATNNTADDSAVARLVTSIFEEAVRREASDVHIEPQEAKLWIRMRVDGMLVSVMETEPKIAAAVLLRIKLLAGLNISERRLPQDGRFRLVVRDAPIDVRLSTLPSQHGESAVMRILSTGSGPRKLDRIGMPKELLARFRTASRRSSGLILVTGPTGSGKTTTLYSALDELNEVDAKIITTRR
jgi:MSHA biogenesis protein MshE